MAAAVINRLIETACFVRPAAENSFLNKILLFSRYIYDFSEFTHQCVKMFRLPLDYIGPRFTRAVILSFLLAEPFKNLLFLRALFVENLNYDGTENA